MKRLIPLFIFVQFASFGLVAAEPTPSVSWLMNEQASLFDIGMMRMRQDNETWWTPELRKRIAGSGLKLKEIHAGGVVYNWADNEITITVSLIGPPREKMCSDVLEKYKDIIAPLRKSKTQAIRKFSISSLAGRFAHVNYTVKRRPKDLDENLSNLFVFTVGISETEDFSGNTIFCKSKLLDDTPTYIKLKKLK